MIVDEESLLLSAPGDATLGAVEALLAARGLTLGVTLFDGLDAETVAGWLGRGAPGTPHPLADPADHILAGFVGTLLDGQTLTVRPEPRRAVGPDLAALVLGAAGRFVALTRAHLRVHRIGTPRPAMPLPTYDLDPPVSSAESQLWDRIATELENLQKGGRAEGERKGRI